MTMDKKSNHSNQQWLLALSPDLYAKDWFDGTGFADKVKAKLSNSSLDKKSDIRAQLLPPAKILLAEGRDLIKSEFLKANDGALYMGGYGLIIDTLVTALFERVMGVMAKGYNSPRLAVLATGGYGRRELAPHSDIDLLFLTSVQADKAASEQIETMLYLLWDLGLRVGHAVRSLRQQIKATKDDITIRTALLDSRVFAGDRDLAASLHRQFYKDIVSGTAEAFLNSKLDEREARLGRIGHQRYVVEPNVKDSKGGLRDLHTLFWIAQYVYQISSPASLINRGIFSPSELRHFSNAQRFLWAVRCHLHLRGGRENDRLTFDAQLDIAPLLGFRDRSSMKGVERFMRRYHLAARTVGDLTRIFWAAIAADFVTKPRPFAALFRRRGAPKPFILEAGRLNLPNKVSFRKHPELMMEMFQVAQNSGLDIHPAALRRLHNRLPLIDASFRLNPDYNEQFLDILASRQNPERVLRLMNESGFLGKFIPDFGRIVAMMQFNMYHSYTVDEHTIFAIGILSGIETGQLSEIAPMASEAIHQITLRKELYVAVFLHDIAKGRDGDHSILGAEVARHLCPQFGFDDDQVEMVAWLIRHHLLMSDIAFRYDLNDPQTIEQFAAKVKSPERLNLLFVLTVADIRAVGPDIWNDWKASLMRDLYTKTISVLSGSKSDNLSLRRGDSNKIIFAENMASSWAASWTQSEIADYIDSFYPDYWASFDTDSYQRHALMFRHYFDSGEKLSIGLNPDGYRNATELIVITADHPGLFSKIAGGVASMGADIVDARIATRKDGLTIDILWFQNIKKQAIMQPSALAEIKDGVTRAIIGTLDIDSVLERRKLRVPPRLRKIKVPARVLLNNNASQTHTVIEVNGKDGAGLLYRLTDRLAKLGLRIQTASVSTYGNKVIDLFYVKDNFGLKITSQERLDNLRNELLAVLKDSDEIDQGTR